MSVWQNEGGHYPEGAYAHGVSDTPRTYSQDGSRLSREEVLKLYEMKLDAVRENLRRRDRANGFFLTLAFVSLPGLVSVVAYLQSASALSDPARLILTTVVAAVAAFLGVPACIAWSSAQRYSQERHAKMVKSIRHLENIHGFGYQRVGEGFWYSPLDEDEHPADGIRAERSRWFKRPEATLFARCEGWMPLVAGLAFLGVVYFIYQEQVVAAVIWGIDFCMGLLDMFWGPA